MHSSPSGFWLTVSQSETNHPNLQIDLCKWKQNCLVSNHLRPSNPNHSTGLGSPIFNGALAKSCPNVGTKRLPPKRPIEGNGKRYFQIGGSLPRDLAVSCI
jgi:hypothetical protein